MTIGTMKLKLAVEALKAAAVLVTDELANPDLSDEVRAEVIALLENDQEFEATMRTLDETLRPDGPLQTEATGASAEDEAEDKPAAAVADATGTTEEPAAVDQAEQTS